MRLESIFNTCWYIPGSEIHTRRRGQIPAPASALVWSVEVFHMNKIILTAHGKRRLKQRCGVGSGSAQKFVQKVYDIGLRHQDLEGDVAKYVTALYHYNQKANNVRIYGDKAYVFSGRTLITVYYLPEHLMESVRKSMKGKKRCSANVGRKRR